MEGKEDNNGEIEEVEKKMLSENGNSASASEFRMRMMINFDEF